MASIEVLLVELKFYSSCCRLWLCSSCCRNDEAFCYLLSMCKPVKLFDCFVILLPFASTERASALYQYSTCFVFNLRVLNQLHLFFPSCFDAYFYSIGKAVRLGC